MKTHRFYLQNLQVVNEEILISDKNILNQILNVFRFKVGSIFIAFDGTGSEYLLEIISVTKKTVTCEIKEQKRGMVRGKRLTLIFSLVKKENVEIILQKCTEIGVTNFVPVISDRTIKVGLNKDRMEKIIIEAVEQSGWADIPMLHEPMNLKKVLENLRKERENLDGVCVMDFDGTSLSSVKHLISVDTIIIGPEGGFTKEERDFFAKYAIKKISLGQNTLRAETACISVASIFLL